MHRVRLIISYNGSNYVGWQAQQNGRSVQQTVEEQLNRLLNNKNATPIRLHASGRTDSGVHAIAQVVHFDSDTKIPSEKIPYALNVSLPDDIRVVYGDTPENDFHARFDVKKKHYRYCLYCSPHTDAFRSKLALHVHSKLDFDSMQAAALDIIGTHDFSAFKSEGSPVKSTVRTIYHAGWTHDGAFHYFEICGNGFMYNMVRILVGTMLEIGKNRLPTDTIKTALASHDRKDAGATAPACGLYLAGVEYDSFNTKDFTEDFLP